MRMTFGLAAVAILAASGCNALGLVVGPGVQGSGILKEEKREVGEFNGVDIGSALQAKVTIGPKSEVTLSGDDNLLSLVKTEVRDGHLVARFESTTGAQTKLPLMLTITTPRLDQVAAGGAAKVSVKAGEAKTFRVQAEGASSLAIGGVGSETIEIGASGASQITIVGKAKGLTIKASGASQIHANGMPAESVKVDASGASQVETNASASIEGDVSGASTIQVTGQPGGRKVSSSGASHVKYVDALR
jgi:Putative auto-transporter adhesin, head GIN domain